MCIKKSVSVFFVLFYNLLCGMFFFSNNPVYKARKYLELSLYNYRQAIKKNPSDVKLIEEYRKIMKASIGKTASDVEMAILFLEIGKEEEVDKILLKVGLTEKAEAIKYIEEKINISQNFKEKITLYKIALKLSPRNGNYWYKLGRIYLGLNKIDEGISALEKAYNFNVENIELFYYLADAYIYKGDFKKAKFYIQEGFKKEENIPLHRLLYSIYRRENKSHLAKNEREKIKQLLVKKTKKVIIKKEKHGKKLPSYNFLLVSKKEQKIHLYNFDGEKFKILYSFYCTTGKNSGDKKEEGDGRTPEGAYLLVRKIDGVNLPSKYGIAAFPLNYPDPIDKREGQNGDGIWFHATPIERPPYNSEGCIVINDNDMKKIIPYVKVKKTFICVFETIPSLNTKTISKIKNALEEWKKAWESKDTEKYISFYDEKFYSNGKNKERWKKYKERINRNKKYIKIKLSDMQILPYRKTSFGYVYVAFFKQDYKSSNFSGKTYKTLYFVKRKDGWKILSENVIK